MKFSELHKQIVQEDKNEDLKKAKELVKHYFKKHKGDAKKS
jgi:hypothetical protein